MYRFPLFNNRLVKALLLAVTLMCVKQVSAQSQCDFRGIAYNETGAILANRNIKVRLAIHDSSSTGRLLYSEIQNVHTNTDGSFVATLGVGNAVCGELCNAEETQRKKYLQVAINSGDNNDYIELAVYPLGTWPDSFCEKYNNKPKWFRPRYYFYHCNTR